MANEGDVVDETLVSRFLASWKARFFDRIDLAIVKRQTHVKTDVKGAWLSTYVRPLLLVGLFPRNNVTIPLSLVY